MIVGAASLKRELAKAEETANDDACGRDPLQVFSVFFSLQTGFHEVRIISRTTFAENSAS